MLLSEKSKLWNYVVNHFDKMCTLYICDYTHTEQKDEKIFIKSNWLPLESRFLG